MKSIGKCKGCQRRKLVNLMRLCKRCNKEAHKHLTKEEMAVIQKEMAVAASARAEQAAKKAAEEEEKAKEEKDAEEGSEEQPEEPKAEA